VTTALFERECTGKGRLVEVAMQEAAYATLTSHLDAYWQSGSVPPRTGNRSHSRSPHHWHHLLAAMGREDLRNDPRFKTNADRVAHIDETDALVGAWTQTLGKMEVFAITKPHHIPCAPVRDVSEVMHDPHMHERGMLEWIDDDEIGRIVVPTSPLRFHGADRVATAPSPKLGQHNTDIYGGWLGLSQTEIADLIQSGVI
jgi:crotonobetainyl-CoA:carnitine CoA-transferase CaiB-like acyl-CoA transferase